MKWLVPAILLALSGCASTYTLEYVTEPRGAYIVHQANGGAVGISPKSVDYGNNPQYIVNGCFRVQGVTAVWASGASVRTAEAITLCGDPGQYTLTLSRPLSYPNLDKDLQTAMMLQQADTARRQQQEAALMGAYSIMQDMRPTVTRGTVDIGGETIDYRESTR